jgi:hypothetical protein
MSQTVTFTSFFLDRNRQGIKTIYSPLSGISLDAKPAGKRVWYKRRLVKVRPQGRSELPYRCCPVLNIKAYRGLEVQLQLLLISAPDGVKG